MIKANVNSQGFDLVWNVPETVDEYNALAPKRNNPCLEDAINSTWYRNGANKFRAALCGLLEEVTGVKREGPVDDKDETPEEKEGVYIKRAFATWAKERGMDPTDKKVLAGLRAEIAPRVQSLVDAIKFDPSEREATGGGNLIGKRDKAMAEAAVKEGKGEKLAALLGRKLNREVEPTVDGIALALKDKRKQDADAEEAALKAELGE